MMNKMPVPALTRAQYTNIIWAQYAVILPHVFHLPVLFSILIMGVLLGLSWQLKKQQHTVPSRSRRIKAVQVAVVVSGLTLIVLQYNTLLGVDAGVAFLIVCLLGKLLEVKQRRDAYIALSLALFVVASLFLFAQSIGNALMGLLGILAVLYAMIQQNINPDVRYAQPENSSLIAKQTAQHGLWRALLKLFLQAVPLLIILFIFFPRLPPLWSVPVQQDRAKTGMTDQMSPGDIANLSQSTELAFRVLDTQNDLHKNLPTANQRYWRGLTLSDFDGVQWTQSQAPALKNTVWQVEHYQPIWFQQNFAGNIQTGFEYQVLLKPTQQPWLFALDTAFSKSSSVGITRDFNLINRRDSYKELSYQAVQLLGIKKDLTMPDWLRDINTQLPVGNNPQSHHMAQQVFANLNKDPRAYANFWLRWIKQQNFVYTLSPPKLSGQRIDQFLLQTRRGFCEHYASAYAFLMRAVGIPARVVLGYQGGQLAPDGQSLEVRQMDAHAWVEVWFAGQGWTRIDPTAAIAPERIERGMNTVMQEQQLFGDGLLNQFKSNQLRLFGKARIWADYASYVWQRDVVGFDQNKQEGFLSRLFGIKNTYSQVLWLSVLSIVSLASVFVVMWFRRRKVHHPLDVPLNTLSERLKKYHLDRQPTEGVVTWLQRVAQQPEYTEAAQQLIFHYQQARYHEQDSELHLRAMKKLVRHWSTDQKAAR